MKTKCTTCHGYGEYKTYSNELKKLLKVMCPDCRGRKYGNIQTEISGFKGS